MKKKYNYKEVKDFVLKHNLGCGIYNTHGFGGDDIEGIYRKDGITIYACYDYGYLEVLGLTEEDWNRLVNDLKETKEEHHQ